MIGKGRFLIMAVVALLVAGCGGKKDPNDNIENKSGVVLTISGIGEFETTDNQTTVATQTLEKIGLFFTNQEKEQSSSPTVDTSKVINVPFDPNDDDEGVFTSIQLAPFVQYINNRLSTIDFDLNDISGGDLTGDTTEQIETMTYGYDVVIRDPETREELWRLSKMLNWCLTLDPADFSEDFEIELNYEEPETLVAAEKWRMSDDERYQSCPITLRTGFITTWIGRPLELPDEAEEDPPNDIKQAVEELVSASDEPPTLTEVVEAVLAVPVITQLQEESAQFELEVELTMNEFELLPTPYTFTVNVTEFDFDSLDTE